MVGRCLLTSLREKYLPGTEKSNQYVRLRCSIQYQYQKQGGCQGRGDKTRSAQQQYRSTMCRYKKLSARYPTLLQVGVKNTAVVLVYFEVVFFSVLIVVVAATAAVVDIVVVNVDVVVAGVVALSLLPPLLMTTLLLLPCINFVVAVIVVAYCWRTHSVGLRHKKRSADRSDPSVYRRPHRLSGRGRERGQCRPHRQKSTNDRPTYIST